MAETEKYTTNPRPDADIVYIAPYQAEYKKLKDVVLEVQCEICFEHIATVAVRDLNYPLTGAMFGSPDKFHGIPVPFYPAFQWSELQCPHCNHRPFTYNNAIPTRDAYYLLAPREDDPNIYYNHPDTRYRKALKLKETVEAAIGDMAGAMLQAEHSEYKVDDPAFEAHQLRRTGRKEDVTDE